MIVQLEGIGTTAGPPARGTIGWTGEALTREGKRTEKMIVASMLSDLQVMMFFVVDRLWGIGEDGKMAWV